MRFSELANAVSPGLIAAAWTVVGNAGLSGNNIFLGIPGGLFVPAGVWKFSHWVDDLGSGGNWSWRVHRPVTGGQAIAHNPSGLFGPTSPFEIGPFVGQDPLDMAFRIEGFVVPEPTTWTALAAALLCLALRRRPSN